MPVTCKKHLRFHQPLLHLAPVFGSDWFALKAEAFARFFGPPVFLVCQTVLVGVWISLNATGVFHFDIYPFILLNLAFSLQAAYAALQTTSLVELVRRNTELTEQLSERTEALALEVHRHVIGGR